MTSVSLIYNPYSLKSRILIAERELDAPENRIVEFMNRESFYDLLRPFRRRYVVWDGLLPELLEEINDPEAEITFIGREADFEAVRAAFGRAVRRWKSMDTVIPASCILRSNMSARTCTNGWRTRRRAFWSCAKLQRSSRRCSI